MSYYRRKRQDARGKQRLGIVFFAIALCSVAGLFAATAWLDARQVRLDPDTLCPVDGSPQYVTVVFDKTDVYNPIQKQFLKRFFNQLKDELVTGARVALFVIQARNTNPIQPQFVVCNPGKGQDASHWTSNPEKLQQRWKQRFEQPLDAAIEEFMQPSSGATSPIFEMLQIVALTAHPAAAREAEKLMIVVSDMLHHTPEWSHYKGQLDFTALQSKPYYQKVRTDLANTEVRILYVRRDGAESIQTKGHAYFWADYVNSINGRVTLIEKIDG